MTSSMRSRDRPRLATPAASILPAGPRTSFTRRWALSASPSATAAMSAFMALRLGVLTKSSMSHFTAATSAASAAMPRIG